MPIADPAKSKNMKSSKIKRSIFYLILTGFFLTTSVTTSDARFWGREYSEWQAYEGGTICRTITYYDFWIKTKTVVECRQL
jgi:hypothetical protein